jgi:hypothetical protein
MTVTITLKDGRKLFGRADMARGHPKKPMSHADVRAKFLDCAAEVIPSAQAQSLLSALEALESAPDIGAILPLMAGPLE